MNSSVDAEMRAHHSDHLIAEIECFPALLRLRKPLVMSTYRIDDGPVLFVRIRTRGGHEGWGEAAASPVMSGETLVGMAAAIKEFIAPKLLGQSALDRARLSKAMRATVFANGGAFAALDIALLDLAGKIQHVSVATLLGGAVRPAIQVLRLIGGSGDSAKDVAEAVELHQQGFRAFKLKVAVAPVALEIATVQQLRQALGLDTLISADANMGWDHSTALKFAEGVSDCSVAFIEQPLPAGDVARLAHLARLSKVPLGIDESLHGLSDIFAHTQAQATHGVSLKSIKLGGVTPLVSTAMLADSIGLSVNLAMMMETGVATAAMVHAAAVIPQINWGLSLGTVWIAENPVAEPDCREGKVYISAKPGLGVAVDVKRIESLRPRVS